MEEELPYRAEYAKSGRSSCKSCKNAIDKGVLRLAIMVQSPMFDGKVPNWYHVKCFFTRQKVKSSGDIAHFQSLRWEDQQLIKDKMNSPNGGKDGSSKDEQSDLNDFSTEYAKSSRSVCRGCEQKIQKNVVRISKKDYESVKSKMYGPQPMWYHVDCFVQNREELEYFDGAEKLPGYYTLGVDDQKELKNKLTKMKRKAETNSTVPTKKQKLEEKKEESKLKIQSTLIFKYRDWLEKNLTKTELQELLEYNDQQIPKGESNILDALGDCMAFGAPSPCPECKEGQLRFRTDGYYCGGNLSGWTKCQYISKVPKRKEFTIPEEFIEQYKFLKEYKCKISERVLSSASATTSQPSSSSVATLKKETSISLPLENLQVALVGKLSKSPKELTKKIQELGGKVVKQINADVVCVITSEEEVNKNSKKIKDAEKANVHVVSEKFLDDVEKGGAALMISQHSLCSWGGDLSQKISAATFTANKSKSGQKSDDHFTKSVPSKIKMMVKGAAAVDPDSELGDIAHVLESRGLVYSEVLGMVDITKGTNSYYKLQVLEGDKIPDYWVFRSWGRVGTTIGGSKTEEFDTKMDAVQEFKRLFEEKTGNLWEDRKNFVKHPNRFYPLDIDYGQEDEDLKIDELKPGSNSKLAKAVQELICLIFDIESMKKAMLEYELDLKKMPLGKISKKQIQQAYSVLTELQELRKKEESQTKILDASNRFYTLIPHDFGMRKPPLLDNDDIIKSKLEMLESLLEIEIAYSLRKEAKADEKIDPVDKHYEQLKTDITALDKLSEEFETINKYLQNTHAETHNMYALDIEEAFKIDRHGESKRFKPFKQLPNRYLLWHGSRLTNFAGILSQGLRIAPPEAPTTGYMFGKGIYFADMVSKSANYCYTNPTSPTGILLLCEVALGNMYERTVADYITKLPPNMHSTKGVGTTVPDPSEAITTPDGTIVPLGNPKKTDVTGHLLYNEYIVYDTAQVNIKYLLKVNFKWKY